MPNESIEDALKEVYALAPNSVIPLDTLEISYVGLPETLYIVKDRVSWDLTLEDSTTHTFKPCGFEFIQPAAGIDGVQQLSLAVDNVGDEVNDFFNALGTELTEPVKVVYRPYLSNDTSGPQLDPPLVLFLVDITMDVFKVSGRATFASIVNSRYPTQYYSAQRFPGLVGRGGNVIIPPDPSDAWEVNRLSYTSAKGVNAEGSNVRGLTFSPDGTKMYTVVRRFELSDKVNEYDLSTAWDIRSAVFNQTKALTYTPMDFFDADEASGISFKPDGTKMYISVYLVFYADEGDDVIYVGVQEYILSTPWDISTASLSSFLDVPGTSVPTGLYFREDGLKLFVPRRDGSMRSYTLSTAWDLSSFSTGTLKNFSDDESYITGVFFKSDGTKMYIVGMENDEVIEYDLNILWDYTTAVPTGETLSIGPYEPSPEEGPRGLYWKSDGFTMYSVRVDIIGSAVYKYDIV